MASYFPLDGTAEKVNFQKEIASMMHGFGDSPNPNAATIVLIENVVLQQLRSIVQEAFNNSQLRGSKIIANMDIIYLMRKNKIKLRRLYDYQVNLDYANKHVSSTVTDTVVASVALDDEKDSKKRNSHIDVIKELDEVGEISQIKFDAIAHLRKIRAERISEFLTFEKYTAYHKARCVSFRSNIGGFSRNCSKLEWWINPNKELKFSQSALDVLCFLAYETVAEIIDAVFLIRQDARKKNGDPFSKFEGGYFCNPVSLMNAVYIKSGYEAVHAITVAEVREVLRRYFTPRVGMNGIFSRNMGIDVPTKYIAI